VSVVLAWAGHTIQVASMYAPNTAAERRQYFQSAVQRVWQRRPQQSVLIA
jgi:hypothetical protein